MRLLLATVFFIAIAGVGTARADDGFRCNGRNISNGDWLSRVIEICGEPDAAIQRTEYRTVRVRIRGYIEERTVEVIIDEMEYDLGPNRFRRYLTFENGRLVDTRTGEKGRS